jgi:SAM-dependent methyltransferase
VADVGPGIGIDGIHFAERGARITFVDIVEDNLTLLRRICSLKGVEADTYYIDDFFRYRFDKQFDAFLFIGSMHHAPFEFSRRQVAAMMPFLRPGGKVVMLAYPKERFIASGARGFEEFAKRTDGERTPWAEWYDEGKVMELFGPAFHLNWSRRFGQHDIEFIWFDLTKVSHE